jgi:hypothetical protein
MSLLADWIILVLVSFEADTDLSVLQVRFQFLVVRSTPGVIDACNFNFSLS